MPENTLEKLWGPIGEALGAMVPILADLAVRVGSVLMELVRRSGILEWFSGLG
ncbi:MAG: hypothetical protein V3S29_06140 [bacterium]